MELFVVHQVYARVDAAVTVGFCRSWRAAEVVSHPWERS